MRADPRTLPVAIFLMKVGTSIDVGHALMQDMLDMDGVYAAIRDAGLELPERPRAEDLKGKLVSMFIKCEPNRNARLRGRRQVMFNDSDIQPLEAVIEQSDVLVLCSDGLTRHVPDDAIAECVSNTPDLRQACELLIEAAKGGGGEDNITCLLLRFVEEPWYKKLLRKWFSWLLPGGGSPKWQNSI